MEGNLKLVSQWLTYVVSCVHIQNDNAVCHGYTVASRLPSGRPD